MLLGSNCVYLQSPDLRMTPAGLSEEGREREGGPVARAHTHTHMYALKGTECFAPVLSEEKVVSLMLVSSSSLLLHIRIVRHQRMDALLFCCSDSERSMRYQSKLEKTSIL